MGLKLVSFAFVFECSIAKRENVLDFFEDFGSVVTNGYSVLYTSCCSLTCHVSITDWFVPFIGREYVDTWYIDMWHIFLFGQATSLTTAADLVSTDVVGVVTLGCRS